MTLKFNLLNMSSYFLDLHSFQFQPASLMILLLILSSFCPVTALSSNKVELHPLLEFPFYSVLCFFVPKKKKTCGNPHCIFFLPSFLQSPPPENKIYDLKENVLVLKLNKNLFFIILDNKDTYFVKKVVCYLNYHLCKNAHSQKPKK